MNLTTLISKGKDFSIKKHERKNFIASVDTLGEQLTLKLDFDIGKGQLEIFLGDAELHNIHEYLEKNPCKLCEQSQEIEK